MECRSHRLGQCGRLPIMVSGAVKTTVSGFCVVPGSVTDKVTSLAAIRVAVIDTKCFSLPSRSTI